MRSGTALLEAVQKSGLSAVELYLNTHWLDRVSEIVKLCRNFPFRYALHAPTDTFRPQELADLASGLQAEVVVFHDILWDDEWETVATLFTALPSKICVENIITIHQPLKLMRRFGIGFCLDLEHLQMEACEVFEEEFLRVMKTSFHVHMTGYTFGSELWHTHIYHSPRHSLYLLDLLKLSDFRGMVVSEARVRDQTLEKFKQLGSFIASLPS